jgi:TetR/AcrR family transcriptional regulator
MAPESRPQDARQTILDAAEQLFAERGYAAASMRSIAEKASTSQALLHHHFGTKAKLYEAVKQRFTERFDLPARLPEAAAPSPGFIVSIVRGYFQFLSDNPNLSRLVGWARLEGDQAPWGASDAIWQRTREWVAQAKAAGLIRAEIDDRLLLVVGGAVVQYVRQALTIMLRGVATPALAGLDALVVG